jgi:CubicO group peptidase (beta-lactamase class C family)
MKRTISVWLEVRIWVPVLLILSLIGCAPTPTTTPSTVPTTISNGSDISRKLDQEIEHLFQESDSPGLAVGVVKDQELI